MNRKEAALADLRAAKDHLFRVQEALSGPRIDRKNTREAISAACFRLDYDNTRVRSWRAMTPAEVARWDAVNAVFQRPEIVELMHQEREGKEAVRLAEIALRAAQKASAPTPKQVGARSAQLARANPNLPPTLRWGGALGAAPTPRPVNRREVGAARAPTGWVALGQVDTWEQDT